MHFMLYIYYIYIFIIYIILYIVEHNSTVTGRTFREHIVADAFRPKKSSSALFVHQQQAPQK